MAPHPQPAPSAAAAAAEASAREPAGVDADRLAAGLDVWIDQDLCTGDGLCVQYARDVFELDLDGLAYVKGDDGELRTAAGERVGVPADLLAEVIDSAKECPGACIHVVRRSDGVEIAGPDAQ